MANFCTNCGADLNKTYKFCPECGTEILDEENDGSGLSKQERSNAEEGNGRVYCDNCGGENSINDRVCSSCGILLNAKIKEESSTQSKPILSRGKDSRPVNHSLKKKARHKKRVKTGPLKTTKKESNEFDSKKLYLIVLVIAIFAFVILFSSGVFDPDVRNVANLNSGTNQSNGSGVDLNNLQKINDLQAKVDANPDDMGLLLELAHLKNDSGFYENAIQLYRKYLEKVPENADARIDMGVCYFNIGNYDTAITEMKKALEFQPNHQIGHLNLGIVNLTAGNIEEAKSWFQKTIELGPDTQVGQRAKELLSTHNL